jgi:hypothetical protein
VPPGRRVGVGRNLQRNLETDEDEGNSEDNTGGEGEISNSDANEPDDEVLREIEQRHNTSMANSVAQQKNTRTVGSVNSISLNYGVGDTLKKDSFRKQKTGMKGVEEEQSDDMSLSSIKNRPIES